MFVVYGAVGITERFEVELSSTVGVDGREGGQENMCIVPAYGSIPGHLQSMVLFSSLSIL